MPDFGNTAKRQECTLNSRDDFLIGKHLGPHPDHGLQRVMGAPYAGIVPGSVAQVTERRLGVMSNTIAADAIT